MLNVIVTLIILVTYAELSLNPKVRQVCRYFFYFLTLTGVIGTIVDQHIHLQINMVLAVLLYALLLKITKKEIFTKIFGFCWLTAYLIKCYCVVGEHAWLVIDFLGDWINYLTWVATTSMLFTLTCLIDIKNKEERDRDLYIGFFCLFLFLGAYNI